MDVELAEVRDFLAAHHPFDLLPPPVLAQVPGWMTMRYVRRDTDLMRVGADNDEVFVLRSGAVDIRTSAGLLMERGEEGACFGTTTLIGGNPSRFTVTAIEDALVLVLPGERWHALAGAHPAFRAFFVDQRAARMRGAVASVQVADSGSPILRTHVREMVRRAPVTIAPRESIRAAAQAMTHHNVSSILVVEGGLLVGIVTDRDLRGRVVAAGRDPGEPVSAVMTPGPSVAGADELAFEVLLQMMDESIHHLPVIDDGAPIGVITSTDLVRLEHGSPVYLVRDVAAQRDVAGVAQVAARLPGTVQRLVSQDASAQDIGHIVTAVADAVGRRLIALAEDELGEPPGDYCWFVLGSQARQEMALASDQDHALILADDAPPELEEYTRRLAEIVTDGLEACGYPRCPGDVMATTPRWRRRRRDWRAEFAAWLHEPEPDALLNAGVFFDARPLHGAAPLLLDLREEVCAAAADAGRFLAVLTGHAVAHEPPLGFFRGFVLQGEGRHKDTLDLKWGGVGAVQELARVFALASGSTQVGTAARITQAGVDGHLSVERAADLRDAFEFLSYVRIRHQSTQARAGLPPDNYVSPEALTTFERRHLKDAFHFVRSAQRVLAQAHPGVRG